MTAQVDTIASIDYIYSIVYDKPMSALMIRCFLGAETPSSAAASALIEPMLSRLVR